MILKINHLPKILFQFHRDQWVDSVELIDGSIKLLGLIKTWPIISQDTHSCHPIAHLTVEIWGVLYDFKLEYTLASGLILGLCPANERRRYFVMTYLIGWVQA